MGFFDMFKKQNKNNIQQQPNAMPPRKIENQNIIEYSCTEDGRLVVELTETLPKSNQFYDTTKLVIDNKQVNLAGEFVQNCMVAWYGQDDCVYLDGSGRDMGRRGQYKNVLAGIDTDLLLNDENYCAAVMRSLLTQRRVDEYLNRGLQDNPDIPCGKYVGEIIKGDKGYSKFFKRGLGQASHNSPEMVSKRQRYQEQVRQRQEREKEEKRAQIAKLQQELDGMR